MSQKPAYITTTLPYVNAEPHIGFALEIVQADTLARYYRLTGRPVFFTTGTDEHGQKIWQKAQEGGEGVQVYVDRYAASFGRLKDALTLSYDAFIRTTDEKHIRAAQELWRRCLAQGDIYKKKYKGLYCVGDEAFVKEEDLVQGRCPNHPNQDPIEIEEENYFFALSKYQQGILDYLSRDGVVVPAHRCEEARRFVAQGLNDFSISREKARMPWGIPVPDDENQVMYVWFDALTNYISTLGWPSESGDFATFWDGGDTLQMAGKDQIRFQSIMWQAMLMSAGVKGTDQVFYHGFITSGGQKMSKSLGNVISPFDLVARYGTEATRYLLLRHVHPTEDTDITGERLDEWYTANLVNGIGNLVARVMKLAETHLEGSSAHADTVSFPEEYKNAINTYQFAASLDYVWQRIGALDARITAEEPFKVVKTDPQKGKEMIQAATQELYQIARLLQPHLPGTSEAITAAILANKKPDNLFPRLAV
jgi:methionyl-tRNA synthetase